MSITFHQDIEVASGEPIVIAGTLYDATGQLLDLTNAVLNWGLLDPNGMPVQLNAAITKTDAAHGAIQVEIPANQTALDPGRYTDSLRVTDGPHRDLFWTATF